MRDNFTTPEQGKKLLAMGVPESTADLRWCISKWGSGEWHVTSKYPHFVSGKNYINRTQYRSYIPCWSVGRLQELCMLSDITFNKESFPNDHAQLWIDRISNNINKGNTNFDIL